MRAIVKHIHSPDFDLASGQIDEPTDFGVLLQLMVGPADWPGEESFDVTVCTPTWLSRLIREQGPVIGRHYLIVDRYDMERAAHFLCRYVEALEAETWQRLAEKIGRAAKWEFEDYSMK